MEAPERTPGTDDAGRPLARDPDAGYTDGRLSLDRALDPKSPAVEGQQPLRTG